MNNGYPNAAGSTREYGFEYRAAIQRNNFPIDDSLLVVCRGSLSIISIFQDGIEERLASKGLVILNRRNILWHYTLEF